MIRLTLDGRSVQARKGEYLLAVARREGIEIPTLCQHDAVEPAGACRLCMVEVTRPEWGDWSKLVTSCLFPAEEGLIVHTRSKRVMTLRKEILELLMARSPDAPGLDKLAREYGADPLSYRVTPGGDNCILCDLCTRICQNLVTGAISRQYRGVDKRVDTPFSVASDVCVGCLACAQNCPTGAIPVTREDGKVTIWNQTFDLVPCVRCGASTLPRAHAEWLAHRSGRPVESYFICETCKTNATADVAQKIAW